ncbi:hypothetical protein [Acuticoccus mangrovi]|uniref:Uncharacterized protein n=1 Tax=Acuticoccus mangrovi TaxID=2796142 RepID=A0A934MJE4_9HYPH|nr:hypothetical protein [Acuticoccus mangrovi]MBJ3774479.1 hypothetical protein [Acuticoccus mangrovi]
MTTFELKTLSLEEKSESPAFIVIVVTAEKGEDDAHVILGSDALQKIMGIDPEAALEAYGADPGGFAEDLAKALEGAGLDLGTAEGRAAIEAFGPDVGGAALGGGDLDGLGEDGLMQSTGGGAGGDDAAADDPWAYFESDEPFEKEWAAVKEEVTSSRTDWSEGESAASEVTDAIPNTLWPVSGGDQEVDTVEPGTYTDLWGNEVKPADDDAEGGSDGEEPSVTIDEILEILDEHEKNGGEDGDGSTDGGTGEDGTSSGDGDDDGDTDGTDGADGTDEGAGGEDTSGDEPGGEGTDDAAMTGEPGTEGGCGDGEPAPAPGEPAEGGDDGCPADADGGFVLALDPPLFGGGTICPAQEEADRPMVEPVDPTYGLTMPVNPGLDEGYGGALPEEPMGVDPSVMDAGGTAFAVAAGDDGFLI